MLNLRGASADGKPFEEFCSTENISRSTFFCRCGAPLKQDSKVSVSLVTEGRKFLGMARGIRSEEGSAPQMRYAFKFLQ
jgi:hypothetical protein